MAHQSIPPPQPMDMKGHLQTNWQYFKDAWHNYEVATELNKKGNDIRVATLLSVMGKDCFLIYKNLPLSEADRQDPKKVLDGLTQYFEPQRNTVYERYVFNTCIQEAHEAFDSWVNRLRKLSATCEYGNLLDEMIRDRIVIGVKDSAVRARLLREKNLSLEKCIDTCRAAEMTSQQVQAIDGHAEVETVHAVQQKDKKTVKKTQKASDDKEKKQTVDCTYCGSKHQKRKCPAWRKTCKKCGRKNHFADVCRSKTKVKVHQVVTDSEDSDSDESVLAVHAGRTKYLVEPLVKPRGEKLWQRQIFQLDNGAGVSCLKYEDCCRILNTDVPRLKKVNKKLTSYSGNRLNNVGQITMKVKINNKEQYVKFDVVKDVACSLLNGETSERFGLMKVKDNLLINQVSVELSEEEIKRRYKDVFEGLGDLGEYHIEIDHTVKPRQDAPRTVPVALKKDLKNKLQNMEKQGIIQRISEPTDWINSMVAVKKPNKLRICLDPKQLNKAVKIPKYKMPVLEDISANLSKAKIFSVVDAKDGFLQVILDEESSKLTTFLTPFGRYRWRRLAFRITSAPEEFQRRVLEIMEGLKGVEVIADDILVYGSGDTYEDAVVEHDKNIIALLERCREKQFKLNRNKLRFKQDSVMYHGHIISSEGVHTCPPKANR